MKITNNFSPISFKPFKILAFHPCGALLHLFHFATIDIFGKKHKIRWSDEGFNFTGVPLIIAGTKIFDCHHGIYRKAIAKEKNETERDQKKVRNHAAEFFIASISVSAMSYTRLYNFCLNI